MGACRLCGAPKLRSLYQVKGCHLHSCGDCGYVQVDPLPPPEAIAAIYDSTYFAKGKYRDDRAGLREQHRRVNLLLSAGLPDGARVLDFGCANGEFLAQARRRWKVWGFDLSAEAVDQARQAMPDLAACLYSGDPGKVAWPADGFDAIVLWDVIEHLPDPLTALRQVVALLRPGGLLAVSTPDMAAPTARILGRRWHFMTPPEHLGFFGAATLGRAFRAVGLSPISFSSRGKWANLGFIFYKLGRVFPSLASSGLVDLMRKSILGRCCLYVPTGDVLYGLARRVP